MDDNDWKVAMSSEVFRGFVAGEMDRLAAEKFAQKEKESANETNSEDEQLNAILEFESFANDIRNCPKKLATFKVLQTKFATDSEYTAKVNPAFVQAVMLLNLD